MALRLHDVSGAMLCPFSVYLWLHLFTLTI